MKENRYDYIHGNKYPKTPGNDHNSVTAVIEEDNYACPDDVRVTPQTSTHEQEYIYAECPPQSPKSEPEYSYADNPKIPTTEPEYSPATTDLGEYCTANNPEL